MKLTKEFRLILPLFLGLILLAGCNGKQDGSEDQVDSVATKETEKPNAIEITATNGLKLLAPDSITSGWNLFRFNNPSGMIHLVLIGRYPEGKGLKEHQELVAPVFQNFMDNINGKELSAPDLGFDLPEWFGEIKFYGGPGLLSGGKTSEVLMNLDPGTYVFECYVKTNGVFHSYNPSKGQYGMATEVIVTDETSETQLPDPTMTINISSENGYEVNGTPTSGDHIVEINYVDQKLYANSVGHDIHLAKLNETVSKDSVIYWMNWANPGGLSTPTPVEFLGGVNEFDGGNKAYLKISLENGKYAWVAEIPKADSVGMYKEFTVGEAQ